jgi:predicted metalloenzyme YecM
MPLQYPTSWHHLEVVLGAHAEALRLEQLALRLESREPLLQLGSMPMAAACAPSLAT